MKHALKGDIFKISPEDTGVTFDDVKGVSTFGFLTDILKLLILKNRADFNVLTIKIEGYISIIRNIFL